MLHHSPRSITLGTALIAAALIGVPLPSSPAQETEAGPSGHIRFERSEPEVPHVHLLWQSRYVVEGRDSLDGAGLFSSETEISFGGFTFAPWYASGYDSDYEELNLNFVYAVELAFGEAYLSYTWLDFITDDLNDNETGAGILVTALPAFDVGLDWYHSYEATGSFFEIFLAREIEVTDALTLTPRLTTGFNAGYVSDGHDGINHVQLALEAALPLNDHIELVAYAGQTFAIGRDAANAPDDELLRDFFFGGLGLTLRF